MGEGLESTVQATASTRSSRVLSGLDSKQLLPKEQPEMSSGSCYKLAQGLFLSATEVTEVKGCQPVWILFPKACQKGMLKPWCLS